MHSVYLLLGGNIDDRFYYLENAISLLNKKVGKTIALSHIVESEPWGFSHENKFINQVVYISTKLNPENLLLVTKEIEISLGRVRNSNGYEARTIDIDILFYDKLIYESDNLVIPHPRLHLRNFTLFPLKEIAIDFYHPVLNKTIGELYNECVDDCKAVVLNL